MKHFRKKGITKKYKKKSHRFTNKKNGGVGKLGKLSLLSSAIGNNAFLPNKTGLHHNSALNRQEKSQLQTPLTNTPYSISSKEFKLDIEPSSNGNKSPPNISNTPFIYLDDNDDDNDKENNYLPLNENGILELKLALKKLGLRPENIIDVLKNIIKLDKRFLNINNFIKECKKEFKTIDYPKLSKKRDKIEKEIILSLYEKYSS